MQDRFTYQAFEVEDLHARENYTYVYNPYDQSVEMYDTSRNVAGGKKLVGRKRDEFPGDCETAYDYYKSLHQQAHKIDIERPVVFLGYVHPETIYPLAEMEEWDESKNIANYKDIKVRLDWTHKIFVGSIKDENIRNLVRKHTYFAGGAIASLIKGDKPKDYDLFFNHNKAMNIVVQYFVNQHNLRLEETSKRYVIDRGNKIDTLIADDGKIKLRQSREFVMSDDEDNKEMNPVVFSGRAISFPNNIQLIIDSDDEETKAYHRFDFVHSMGSYIPKEDKLNVPEYVARAIENNELIYNIEGTNPVGSSRRLLRFIERGWKISRKEHNKLLRNIAKCDVEILELDEDEYIF